VAGIDRKATRWGAMLAFGAVVAAKLRRLVSGDDSVVVIALKRQPINEIGSRRPDVPTHA